MRPLKLREIEQRGCRFCADRTSDNNYSHCPHEECPYHELDNVKTYGEYMEKTDGITIGSILKLQGRKV